MDQTESQRVVSTRAQKVAVLLVVLAVLGCGCAAYLGTIKEQGSLQLSNPVVGDTAGAAAPTVHSDPLLGDALAVEPVTAPSLLFGFARTRFIVAASIAAFVILAAVAASVTVGVLYQLDYFSSDALKPSIADGVEQALEAEERARLEAERAQVEAERVLKEQQELQEQLEREKAESDQRHWIHVKLAAGGSAMLAASIVALVCCHENSRERLGTIATCLDALAWLAFLAGTIAMFVVGKAGGGFSFFFSGLAGPLIVVGAMGLLKCKFSDLAPNGLVQLGLPTDHMDFLRAVSVVITGVAMAGIALLIAFLA